MPTHVPGDGMSVLRQTRRLLLGVALAATLMMFTCWAWFDRVVSVLL